jgi:hypothetical protein
MMALTLDASSFTVIKHASAPLSSPYDRSNWIEQDLRECIHYPEIEKLVKEQTGAKTVSILGGAVRTRLF